MAAAIRVRVQGLGRTYVPGEDRRRFWFKIVTFHVKQANECHVSHVYLSQPTDISISERMIHVRAKSLRLHVVSPRAVRLARFQILGQVRYVASWVVTSGCMMYSVTQSPSEVQLAKVVQVIQCLSGGRIFQGRMDPTGLHSIMNFLAALFLDNHSSHRIGVRKMRFVAIDQGEPQTGPRVFS